MLTSGKLKDYFSGTESNDVSSFMKEVGAESKSVRVVNMDVSLKFYDSSSSGVLTRTLRSRIFNVVPSGECRPPSSSVRWRTPPSPFTTSR